MLPGCRDLHDLGDNFMVVAFELYAGSLGRQDGFYVNIGAFDVESEAPFFFLEEELVNFLKNTGTGFW